MLERPEHSICALTILIVTSVAFNCQVFHPCLLFNPATLISPLDTYGLLRQRSKDLSHTVFMLIQLPPSNTHSHIQFHVNTSNIVRPARCFFLFFHERQKKPYVKGKLILFDYTHPGLNMHGIVFASRFSFSDHDQDLHTHTHVNHSPFKIRPKIKQNKQSGKHFISSGQSFTQMVTFSLASVTPNKQLNNKPSPSSLAFFLLDRTWFSGARQLILSKHH